MKCNAFLIFGAISLAGIQAASAKPFASFEDVVPNAAERVVSFYNVGPRKDERDGYRPPHYMVGVSGWKEFIQKNIAPEFDWGVRRWALHNPFGSPTDGRPMLFDQFLVAQAHDRPELTTDFVEAWTDFLQQHPGVELIIYLGKMRSVDTFEQNLPERPDLYLERALEAVRPILRLREYGKVAVAFDASSGVSENHPVYHFMRLINSLGVPVYCEAWPHKDNMHLATMGVTAAERFYQRAGLVATDHDGDQPDAHDRIPPEAFQGEIAILVTGSLAENRELDRDPKALADLIREIVEKRGFTVFAPVKVLMGSQAES